MNCMNSVFSDLSALRAEVFHAALRVKYNSGRMGDAARDAQRLVGECQRMALEVEALPCGSSPEEDYLVNKQLLVRLCPRGSSPEAQANALRERLRERGAAMGLLVDFDRDLMVDGLVTIMNGSEL